MQATYFCVAEEEVQASQEQVSHVPDHRHGRSGHHIDANLVSMLSGGVLLVRSALQVAASSLPRGALLLSHGNLGASAPASAALNSDVG